MPAVTDKKQAFLGVDTGSISTKGVIIDEDQAGFIPPPPEPAAGAAGDGADGKHGPYCTRTYRGRAHRHGDHRRAAGADGSAWR